MKEVEEAYNYVGLHVDSYSPGDGVTRYRFFVEPPYDYFAGRGIYTALGRKDALTFVNGYRYGRTQGLKEASLVGAEA